MQNLRRFVGYDVQYFATVEPQRRLAPHLHMAIRGTISRAELRQVVAATYHQVWWPSTNRVVFDGEHLPVWDEAAGENGGYLDPATGEVLPTWDEALDAVGLDEDAEPLHVVRFGRQIDAQGVMPDSPQSRKLIGYLTKYLIKGVAECHTAQTAAQREHADRMAEELRYEPCSPTCANWLRYGVQPKNPARASPPATAKAKHTDTNTSATAAAASWSPANGPARPSPITRRTARRGSWPGSLRPESPCSTPPTRTPSTSGNAPDQATRT